jgi:hypothetical protein
MIRFADPIDLDTLRIRHEFISAPDLRASAHTIAAQLHIASWHALAELESLVAEGFLERTTDSQYIRVHGAVSK